MKQFWNKINTVITIAEWRSLSKYSILELYVIAEVLERALPLVNVEVYSQKDDDGDSIHFRPFHDRIASKNW